MFNSKSGSWQTANLGDAKTCKAAESLFREYGFDWKDFADRKRNDRKKIAGVSALAYIKAEAYLRRIHGEVKMPDGVGAKVFLADTGLDTVGAIHEIVKRDGGGTRVYLANVYPEHFVKANDVVQERMGAKVYLANNNNHAQLSEATQLLNGEK